MTRGVRCYARLLALYPRAFRDRFGDEMCLLFSDQLAAAQARGRAAVMRLWIHTLLHLVESAVLEHGDARRERRIAAARFPNAPRRDRMTTTLATDARFALRMLRKSPLFTAIAVLVISLGAGAVATIFSAMNAMLLRPLPGAHDATRLVRVERVQPSGADGAMSASYPYYAYVRDHARSLAGTIAWAKVALTVSTRDEGSAVYGSLVSANFFSVLGVRPALGRFFAPDDDRAELATPAIVVSESFWRARLGADSGVVGRTLLVNGRAYTLVGVAPAAFRGLDAPIRTDAWVPLAMAPQLRAPRRLDDAGTHWLHVAARLRDGVTAEGARAELVAVQQAYASGAERDLSAWSALKLTSLSGLPSDARGTLAGFLALLLGAAALVLLIASVNVAAMLSARAIGRRREMALRAALGAARSRLVRHLLLEVACLFTAGALGGFAVATAATSALERIPMPRSRGNVTIALELSPDLRVLAFALGVSLVTGLIFGLAPALRGTRHDLTTPLRGESAGAGRRTAVAGPLVVGQLALSLVLLVAAGLFLRALDRGRHVDPGFDATGVSVAAFDTESWGYDDARAHAFYRELRERVAALPGVTSAAYAEYLPLVLHSSQDEIEVPGAHGPNAERPDAVPVHLSNVSDGYLPALRIPVMQGRDLRATDDERAGRVAVVNETFARRFWPNASAVGRAFRYGGAPVTIAGVARDAKYSSPMEDTPPMVYVPLAQSWRAARYLVVRAAPGAPPIGPALQRIVRAIDPTLPRPAPTLLREENAIVTLPQRVAAIVTGALGAVGLLLASVGLYGVIAYSAGRRTREIGIRVAIGARRGDVLAMIVRDGLRLAAIGVGVGAVAALGAARLIRGLLFDVSPLDWPTFAATTVVLIAVAAFASWLPARRAAGADPLVALRAE